MLTPSPTLDGPRWEPRSKPRHLVLLLHGVGADGNALFHLASSWIGSLPGAVFVAPNAPYTSDAEGSAYDWFSVGDCSADAYLAGARTAAPILDAFIDRELTRYELLDDQLALVGFSQGAMMALHVGLRRCSPCAAVAAYSGELLAPEILDVEIGSRPPVLLVHGDVDREVTVDRLAVTANALQANRVPVTASALPNLGHRIDETGARLGARFLTDALASQRPVMPIEHAAGPGLRCR